MPVGALLVVGTGSGVGKSVVVAGLCRWLAREGVRVAPFKAQNMSLNSYVTRAGEEIGRAQAAQARACYIEPEAVMAPVLLKPGSGSSAQLIVLGKAVGEHEAGRYRGNVQGGLLGVVTDAFAELARRFDAVICEGAGSPAEVNLRGSDIVNMGFARATGVPVVLVGDIDPGGIFASLVGTLAVLSPADQALIAGFVVNKFRGDRALLEPGLEMLRELTGRPTLGVLPFVGDIGLDAEDSVDRALLLSGGPPIGDDVLRVHVVALPRHEQPHRRRRPGRRTWCRGPLHHRAGRGGRRRPGGPARDPLHRGRPGLAARTRPRRGPGAPRRRRPARARRLWWLPMLGTVIDDPVESGTGRSPASGLLRCGPRFGPDKVLARPRRALPDGTVVEGYDPSRRGDKAGRGAPGGRRGLPGRGGGGDGVARAPGKRRLPAHLPGRGRPHLRPQFRRRPGHVDAGPAGGATGRAGRSGRPAHRPGRGQKAARRGPPAPLPRSGSSSGTTVPMA